MAPRLARRFGLDRTLALVLGILTVGLVVRLGPTTATLIGGTILAGAAIAVANVLVPPLVRREFPGYVGLATGLYTGTLTLAATVAAAATVPLALATGLGWRGGLGVWAIPALGTLVAWLPRLHGSDRTGSAPAGPDAIEPAGPAPADVGAPIAAAGAGAAPAAAPGSRSLLRDRRAWSVTTFMGLQSLGFYATLAWLPTIYRGEGMSATDAGLLLAATTLVAIPAGIVVTWRAGINAHQSGAIVGATLLGTVGLAGLALAPTAVPLLWAALLGIGQGMTFPLALTIVVLRSGSLEMTARLSAMAQSIGYVLAAFGLLVTGALRDATDGWAVPIALLVGLSLVQAVAGWAAGREGLAGEPTSAGVSGR